jgi:exodeoxyribonuclease-1
VRVNAGPTVSELCDAPEALTDSIELNAAEARARRIKADAAFCRRLVDAHIAVWTRRPESPHLEDQLYSGGFPSPDNERRMSDFHSVSGRTECLEILAAFDDPRLRAFAARLVHSERRSWLGETERRAADLELAQRLTDDIDGGPLTLGAAMAEIDRLTADGTADPLCLLPGYRRWLEMRAAGVAAFLAEHAL